MATCSGESTSAPNELGLLALCRLPDAPKRQENAISEMVRMTVHSENCHPTRLRHYLATQQGGYRFTVVELNASRGAGPSLVLHLWRF